MFVEFGCKLFIQAIGTRMGINCASNLANFFLAMRELQFVQNLATVITTTPANSEAHIVARGISKVSAMTRRYIDDLSSINIVAPVRVRRTRTTRTRCVPVRTRFCVMTSGVRQTGAARNKQL